MITLKLTDHSNGVEEEYYDQSNSGTADITVNDMFIDVRNVNVNNVKVFVTTKFSHYNVNVDILVAQINNNNNTELDLSDISVNVITNYDNEGGEICDDVIYFFDKEGILEIHITVEIII